jgi:hypothetical protein
MMKPIVNGNEPPVANSLQSPRPDGVSSLSQAEVIPAQRMKAASARNKTESAPSNASPLAGACVIQVPSPGGAESRGASGPQ